MLPQENLSASTLVVIEGHFLPISSTSYFIFNKRVFLVELLFNIFAYIAASMEHVSGSEHVIVYLLLPVHLQNGKSVSSKSGKDLFFYSSVLGEGLPHLYGAVGVTHWCSAASGERIKQPGGQVCCCY